METRREKLGEEEEENKTGGEGREGEGGKVKENKGVGEGREGVGKGEDKGGGDENRKRTGRRGRRR